MPFDCVPIIIPQSKWAMIEAGVKPRGGTQQILQDVYGQQKIFQDGLIPRQLVENNPYFKPTMRGLQVPIANHIFLAGIDLIRDEKVIIMYSKIIYATLPAFPMSLKIGM